MPKIRRIAIKNFRSIVDLKMDVSDLTAIVGDNDCGKSNVLRALNLFFNGQTNPDTDFSFSDDYNRFAERKLKKAPEIEVEIDLEIPQSYRDKNGDLIRWRKRWRAKGIVEEKDYRGIRRVKKRRGTGFTEIEVMLDGRSRVPLLLSRIRFEYVPAVRSADFFKKLRGRIFKVIAEASEQRVRQSSSEFEKVISGAVLPLLSDIGSELNDNSRLSLPNDLTPLFQSLDFLAGEKSISLDSRGDGIKARYIPLILKFIAEQSREVSGISPTFIWAYEEPENNLEFRRAQELADAFYKLAEDDLSQVLLTTHSPIFYNMHSSDEKGLCTAYHLTHLSPTTGTEAKPAIEATISLDQSMGAMAIIAPYIKAAQEELAQATSHAADLEAKLEALNPERLPTIFVEGQTDYAIFKKLLELFRSDYSGKLFLAEPPQRAGANYVTNMLRSWELRAKHRQPLANRRRAFGIIDGDPAGERVRAEFESVKPAWKYVGLYKLEQPRHLRAAWEQGINIPICLEELWPVEVWRHAEKSDWLMPRPPRPLLGDNLLDWIAADKRLSDLIEEEWRIYFDRQVNNSKESTAKTEWVSWILSLSPTDLEPLAAEHLRVLDKAILKLDL